MLVAGCILFNNIKTNLLINKIESKGANVLRGIFKKIAIPVLNTETSWTTTELDKTNSQVQKCTKNRKKSKDHDGKVMSKVYEASTYIKKKCTPEEMGSKW